MMYSMPYFFYYGCFDVDVLKYEKLKHYDLTRLVGHKAIVAAPAALFGL